MLVNKAKAKSRVKSKFKRSVKLSLLLTLPLLATATLSGCLNSDSKAVTSATAAEQATQQSIDFGFIAFGDSGYHTDYLKEKQFVPARKSLQDFVAFEKNDWFEDGRVMSEFTPPPSEYVAEVGSMIETSGMYPVAKAMTDYCQAASCEFSVMLGDNIYPDGATMGIDGKDDRTRFDDIFTKPFGKLGAGKPDYHIYTALGNHDWNTSRAGAMAQVDFMQTTKPFYMDGIFYSVKPAAGNGDIEIFVIDTEVMLGGTTVMEAELNADGSEKKVDEIDQPDDWTKPINDAEHNMAKWLEQGLKNSTAKWKLVVGHHPIWSTGGTKFEQARSLRKLILPSLCKYADVYFAGHEHSLELHEDSCDAVFGANHNAPPLLQVISGAAAKQRGVHSKFKAYQDKTYQDNTALYTKGMIWGFSHIQLTDDNAEITMHTTPNSGTGEVNLDFTYQYQRRSSVVSTLIERK